MIKGLMDCCMSQAIVVDHVRARVEASEAELGELKAWKAVQEKKFDLTKRLLEEAEVLKNFLQDKEDEITNSKKLLHRAKDDAIKEYCDFDALLFQLGGSFADGFDDCLR